MKQTTVLLSAICISKAGLIAHLRCPLGRLLARSLPLATRAGKIALYGFDGGLEAIDTLGINNSELTDDGLWNPDDEIIDDGEWG